jgi:hypothetical protein
MLNDIFLDMIKADFIKAIGKHAQAHKANKEDIQIRIKLDDEEGLSYAIHNQWNCIVPKCSFKEVMHMQIDVFGKENILSPHIYELLLKQISKYNADASKFSAFLFERHKTICCALHNGTEHIKICTLAELFSE